MAVLQAVAGGDPVSVRIWSRCLLGGRPGGRLQSGLGRRPSERLMPDRSGYRVNTCNVNLAELVVTRSDAVVFYLRVIVLCHEKIFAVFLTFSSSFILVWSFFSLNFV